MSFALEREVLDSVLPLAWVVVSDEKQVVYEFTQLAAPTTPDKDKPRHRKALLNPVTSVVWHGGLVTRYDDS